MKKKVPKRGNFMILVIDLRNPPGPFKNKLKQLKFIYLIPIVDNSIITAIAPQTTYLKTCFRLMFF